MHRNGLPTEDYGREAPVQRAVLFKFVDTCAVSECGGQERRTGREQGEGGAVVFGVGDGRRRCLIEFWVFLGVLG